jgi:hypothetical protein
MIADLKPYPNYKGSGLLWLGQVQRHPDSSRRRMNSGTGKRNRHRANDWLGRYQRGS